MRERFSILSEKPNEPKKPIPESSFQNLLLFLGQASIVPIELKTQFPPKDSLQTQKQWEFRYSIAGRYLVGDDTLDEIAGDSLTRERIRQIVKKGVKTLWDNSPQELKDRFPFASFDFRKPLSLKSRQRSSLAHGGMAPAVYNLISQGKSPGEIKKALGVTDWRRVRFTLKSWGIDISRQNNDYSKLAEAQITGADAQKVLDSIRNTSVRGMLRRTNHLIVAISTVARKANLYPGSQNVRDIFAALKARDVPSRAVERTLRDKNGQELKRTEYIYILPAVFEQRAIKVLENAHELEHLRENPVTVLGKPTDQIPNTTELRHSGKCRHLSTLIKEIRGKALGPRSKVKIAEILERCPVPVYRNNGNNLYEISQESQLRPFLAVRLEQFGLRESTSSPAPKFPEALKY